MGSLSFKPGGKMKMERRTDWLVIPFEETVQVATRSIVDQPNAGMPRIYIAVFNG
jgi:hypothetical protein